MSTDSTYSTSGTGPAFRVATVDEEIVAHVAQVTGLSATTARILALRGIHDKADADRFLAPDLSREWVEPSAIPGMAEVADVVADAVRQRSRILVFGDFDLDGISSSAIVARGLSAMGADVRAIIPNRFTDGYGLTDASVDRILEDRPDLVVTVDCGISSRRETQLLRDAGVAVCVTDHHEPGSQVPQGVPVANPKLADEGGSRDLAGAGVALKLVAAVGALLGQEDAWRELVDLATLGTIADMVPLVGENRAIVSHGLMAMRAGTSPKTGIASLAAVSGTSIDSIDAQAIAFSLAPRLNAAGRMADPAVSLNLLMTDDPADAEALAQSLDEFNRIRQSVEHDLATAASELARREFREGDRALVLAGEGWHEGVKGIVASRLAREYRVPVILMAIEDGEARGSGRSAGAVDLFSAVSRCEEVLIRFGGHEAAVGVTVAATDIDRFKELLLEALDELPAEQFDVSTEVDATLPLEDVSVELAVELEALAPFGHSNRRPIFGSPGVFMNGRERVGRTANHLKFTAFDGVVSVPAISFRCTDIENKAAHDAAVDLAYEISADEWRGRKRVQLIIRDLLLRPEGERGAAAELVEDLFEHADAIIAREEYVGIEDAESFHTKLAGVTFEGRQEVVERLEAGTPLRLEREPENPHDPNACAVHDPSGAQVGFLNRRLAAVLAPVIDAGVEYDVEVTDVTGGEEERSRGVNVLISRRIEFAEEEAAVEAAADRRKHLETLSREDLESQLVEAFIGDGSLHDAQRQALEALDAGESTLAVMATGRGKSLIFQLRACVLAITEGKASVFAYPLRALVADQAFHLEETLAPLGIGVAVLTGESSPNQRDETFAAIASGDVDLVLTTPEFLVHHAGRYAQSGRIGFVVVDEAHHVAEAASGHRPAYGRLDETIEVLGGPEVLAVTATADDDIAQRIIQTLGITKVIADPTTRENLVLEDSRGGGDKDAYIAALAAKGHKGIVYVNSREQSVRLARMLRKKVPELAYKVAFYNGGLNRSSRHAVERAFRAGDVSFIIATSAFGEGVNIPDVRDVVLYHLPFNDVEFNQMCGRAGRDAAVARVHPIFSEKDGRVNQMILSSMAPERDEMAGLYLVLRDAPTDDEGWIEITNAELAETARGRDRKSKLNDKGVSSALGVFRELGLVESEGYGPYRRLRVLPRPEEKTDLTSSVRYSEGKREIEEFESFREWVLGAPADELLHRFNRPILPTRV